MLNHSLKAFLSLIFLFAGTISSFAQVTGPGNTTSGTDPIVYGKSNAVSGQTNGAFGFSNNVAGTSTNSFAFGGQNSVAGYKSYVIGKANIVNNGYENVAIGIGNTSNYTYSISIGRNNYATASSTTAIGVSNSSSAAYSTSMGRNNTASGASSLAIGIKNQAIGINSVAFGNASRSLADGAVTFGIGNQASYLNAMAFGKNNFASGEMASAFGYYNSASGKSSSAFGKDNIAGGYMSSVFGKESSVTSAGEGAIAIGYKAAASAAYAGAIGFNLSNNVANSVKIGTSNTSYLFINNTGGVAIGTTDAKGYKLAVAGSMIAESVKVALQANWPDYVFEKNYELTSLLETEKYIKENKHLPEIPSAKEVKDNGLNLGEMNSLLLKKVEELTLHLIEQNKVQIDLVRNQINLTEEITNLKNELKKNKR